MVNRFSVLPLSCKAGCLLGIVFGLFMPGLATAHFPWLVVGHRDTDTPEVRCFFSESSVESAAEFLKYVQDAKVWMMRRDGTKTKLLLKKKGDVLRKPLTGAESESILLLEKQFGILERGGVNFLLKYYAKTGPSLRHSGWRAVPTSRVLKLDVVPSWERGKIQVRVTFQQKPAANAEVTLVRGGEELDGPLVTDAAGLLVHSVSKNPVDALRVKWVEKNPGKLDGQTYSEVRHFTTVTFPRASYELLPTSNRFPRLPEPVTSFGAAIQGNTLYFYGGHTGDAHTYAREMQSQTLWALDLKQPKPVWRPILKGPHLQGLALVTDGKALYRLGGFTAKNNAEEKQNLWSQAKCASFLPGSGNWSDLPDLPEPRSSFDACILDNKIYVIGGWALRGKSPSIWHETAWKLDLKDPQRSWKPLAAPPFQRRALAVAAHRGKVYAIGGMQRVGGPTTRVAVYDPSKNKWSSGPRLVGHSLTGFGASAHGVNRKLVVSTYGGTVQELASDGRRWLVRGNLANERFFHRMLPISQAEVVLLGGASMEVGKFEEVELLDLGKNK